MVNGTVKFFNADKGFGFISADDNSEYFVHISDVDNGVILKEDDNVTFEIVDGDRGPKASKVQVE